MKTHLIPQPGRPKFDMTEIQDLTPHAFNASLLPVIGTDMFLCAFRGQKDDVLTCFLDRDYKRVSTPLNLGLHANNDPRLIVWRDRVWMTTRYFGDWEFYRIEAWLLDERGLIDHEVPEEVHHMRFNTVHDWPGYTKRRESNWVPFIQDGELYYEYSFAPHRIVHVHGGEDSAHLRCMTETKPFSWGGGGRSEYRLNVPPAQLPDGSYLGIIHDKVMNGWHYNSGFYRFEGVAPWRVIEMSPVPVILPEHAVGPLVRSPVSHVVFPLSMQVEGDLVRVAGGSNDSTCIVLHFSLKEVLASLRTIGGHA